MNLLVKIKLFSLDLDSLSLRKNKITSLEREVSVLIALAKILAYVIYQVVDYTLFAQMHYKISLIKFKY